MSRPRDLSRLLRPRSIAVFGGVWARNVVVQCIKAGFRGDVWPVHPARSEIGGRPAFASVADLPGAPDAAFVAVNRDRSVDIVGELAATGCGGVVAFASGFAESGAAEAQDALVAAAGAMPVLGPNCYGLVNALDGAVIWPDQHGCRAVQTGVAILSQSSNIAISLSMQRRGLPVAYLACLGNMAQTGVSELAAAMLEDDRVTALGLYLEGVGDAAALADVVQAARRAGKGVCVLKAGRSEAGVSAAATHTASLAGAAVASSAFFARIGAAEVQTLPALIETLKIFHLYGPLDARRYVSVSCSGGEAGLMADAAKDTSLDFPALGAATRAALTASLGDRVTLSNPLDYQTYIWGDVPKMTEVFSAALSEVDAGLFVLDLPRSDLCDTESFECAVIAIQAAARSGKPVFAVATMPESVEEALACRYLAAGVVPLLGMPEAVKAIEAATCPMPAEWSPWPPADCGGTLLDEAASKAVLAHAGIQIPRFVRADRPAALDPAGLAAPYAFKGLGLVHKSDVNAVRLNVTDPRAQAPIPGATGYLLEEMVQDNRAELLLGLRRDPVYGATLTLGMGGIAAELLADTVTLVLPVAAADVEAALRRLRLWPLLDGYRGRPRPALQAAIDVALRMQDLFVDATLTEIEINPLVLTADSAVAVDALIRRSP